MLRERRRRGDAIETFKTIKGFNRVDREAWFTISGPEARATQRTASITEEGIERREDSLFKPSVNLELRRNFFTIRTISTWNEIHDNVRNQRTVNGFKYILTSLL